MACRRLSHTRTYPSLDDGANKQAIGHTGQQRHVHVTVVVLFVAHSEIFAQGGHAAKFGSDVRFDAGLRNTNNDPSRSQRQLKLANKLNQCELTLLRRRRRRSERDAFISASWLIASGTTSCMGLVNGTTTTAYLQKKMLISHARSKAANKTFRYLPRTQHSHQQLPDATSWVSRNATALVC